MNTYKSTNYTSDGDSVIEHNQLTEETFNSRSRNLQGLNYYRGRYWVNGKPAHGVINFDTNWNKVQNSHKNLLFFKGFLLKPGITMPVVEYAMIGTYLGSERFFNALSRFTHQPIPVHSETMGIRYIIKSQGEDRYEYIYTPIGNNAYKYEFSYGYFIYRFKVSIKNIKPGDRIVFCANCKLAFSDTTWEIIKQAKLITK